MSEVDEPSWSYLEGYFGEGACALVDHAVQSRFEAYRRAGRDIPRDEFYLITEGIAYAVLKQLHDAGLRVIS